MPPQKIAVKPSPSKSKSTTVHSKSVLKPERHILQEMSAYSQKLANDPKAAREFLTSAGIITAKGNLRKIYGG